MAEEPPVDRTTIEQKLSLEQRLEELALRELEMSDLERLGSTLAPKGPDSPLNDLPWRDHGQAGAVERIWDRLDGSLRTARRRRSQRPLVALSAAAAIFALGVLAGRTTVEDPGQVPEVVAEQLLAPEPAHPEQRREARDRSGRPSTAATPGPRRASPRRHAELRRNVPAPSVQPEPEEPVLVEAELPLAPVVRSLPELPRWLTLADLGEYAAAFQAVDQEGGFDAALAQSSAEELMTLADVARAAGQQGRAIQALRRVVQLYLDDPNAPVAAMMLGNLLHRAGDAVGAAEAYALNRSLSPQGDFAEDALAREFEVALEASDIERARALATQYEKEFPQGRRMGEVREQLGRVERDEGPGDLQREGSGRDGARDSSREGAVREGREGVESRPAERSERQAPRE